MSSLLLYSEYLDRNQELSEDSTTDFFFLVERGVVWGLFLVFGFLEVDRVRLC